MSCQRLLAESKIRFPRAF